MLFSFRTPLKHLGELHLKEIIHLYLDVILLRKCIDSVSIIDSFQIEPFVQKLKEVVITLIHLYTEIHFQSVVKSYFFVPNFNDYMCLILKFKYNIPCSLEIYWIQTL